MNVNDSVHPVARVFSELLTEARLGDISGPKLKGQGGSIVDWIRP